MTDRTQRFHVPMRCPADVVPHLADPDKHWREGKSAHALATTWFNGKGLPGVIRKLFDGHEHFRSAELVDAILERRTDLRDGVKGESQTDLLAVLGIGPALAVAAVEGKVVESFGDLVSVWLNRRHAGQAQRSKRLNGLANLLDVAGQDLSHLRYQLFHRAASAIYEAQRYRASTALLLVHSFSGKQSGWDDFAGFLRAIGLSAVAQPNLILGPKQVKGVQFYAAWATDRLPAPPTAIPH